MRCDHLSTTHTYHASPRTMIIRVDDHCKIEWPSWACTVGNACGFASSVLWFVVLVPQLLLNHRRRSTQGLSLVWALCNFTASLLNVTFVFRAGLPLFSRMSAVYMPVVEAVLLLQFFWYRSPGAHPHGRTLVLLAAFGILWTAGVVVEMLVPRMASALAWVAVVLWSVETLPQIFLNWYLDSTAAQSRASVTVAFAGKTTDFAAAYMLDMPLQVAVLAFFSSGASFVNVAQILWIAARRNTTSATESGAQLLEDTLGKDRAGARSRHCAFQVAAFAVLGCVALMAVCLGTRAVQKLGHHPVALLIGTACPASLAITLAAGWVWARATRRANAT